MKKNKMKNWWRCKRTSQSSPLIFILPLSLPSMMMIVYKGWPLEGIGLLGVGNHRLWVWRTTASYVNGGQG
jgi:hypothetical protein